MFIPLCILIYVLFISNIEHLCNTESFVAIFSHWALETSLCSLRSVVAWSFCARWVYERAENGAGLESRWTRDRTRSGHETAPPLVQDQRAASRRSWQRYKVLVIVETKPLWCSVFRTSFPLRFWRPSPPPSFSEHSSTVATTTTATGSSLQLPSLPWRLLTMVMPTTTRLWQFLTGELPLANRLVLAAFSLNLKASKNGTSDLSQNTRGAQVWRVTKHRPC